MGENIAELPKPFRAKHLTTTLWGNLSGLATDFLIQKALHCPHILCEELANKDISRPAIRSHGSLLDGVNLRCKPKV
jgi:hypothetical protein